MGKGRGRPAKEIDQELFERMCERQCTEEAIASMLGVSKSTLYRWCKETYGTSFQSTFTEKRLSGVFKVRDALYEEALNNREKQLLKYLDEKWGYLIEGPLPMSAESEMSAHLAELDDDAIRQTLLDQLKAAGRDTAVNRELVEDYVSLWAMKQWAIHDLQVRGPVITYNNGGGQSGTKVNPSLEHRVSLSKQMMEILKLLDLIGENAALGGDSFDGL